MDHKSIMVVLVSFLVLVFAGQVVEAGFKTCMARCSLGCLVKPDKVKCGLKCLTKCSTRSAGDSAVAGAGGACLRDHDYCKLGCAVNKCSDTFSSVLENAVGIEAASAVETLDSCMNECGLGECGRLLPADGGCAVSESEN